MLQRVERWDQSESTGSVCLHCIAVGVSIWERRGQVTVLLPRGCDAESMFHVLAAFLSFPLPQLLSQQTHCGP